MYKGSDMIGKPVVSFDTGRQLESVSDLIFDHESSRLVGFMINPATFFGKARVLALSNVQTIGQDAILVASESAVVPADAGHELFPIMEKRRVLKGTTVMTTDGRNLGAIVDFFFDPQSGIVEGYEVSGGLFADAATGRSFLPAPEALKIGDEVAFVAPSVADAMQEQDGGLKASLATAGDKLSDWKDAAGRKVENLSAGAQGAAAGVGVEQAVGQRARHAVIGNEGRILVAPGQIVTASVVERARTQNREAELLDAVGLDTGEAVGSHVIETLHDSAEQAKETVGHFFDSVKQKFGVLHDRSSQELEERRIKNALGRPTNRVILDPQDNVLLNLGELITNKAVEQARQSGVLDILFSSVSDEKPDISQDSLRAPEHGRASLEVEHGLAKPGPVPQG